MEGGMSGGSPEKRVRLVIEGRVQGVWYRGWLVERAGRAGLDGWVRNRRDGTVEAVLQGPAELVDAGVAECRRRPPAARVGEVRVSSEAEPAAPGFRQLPTV